MFYKKTKLKVNFLKDIHLRVEKIDQVQNLVDLKTKGY